MCSLYLPDTSYLVFILCEGDKKLLCAIKGSVIIPNAGLVGLQAAVMNPVICKGIILLNISLRMLHIKKQPWYGKPLIKSFQSLLRWGEIGLERTSCVWLQFFQTLLLIILSIFFSCRNTALGKFFFKTVATPESVRNILCQVILQNISLLIHLYEWIISQVNNCYFSLQRVNYNRSKIRSSLLYVKLYSYFSSAGVILHIVFLHCAQVLIFPVRISVLPRHVPGYRWISEDNSWSRTWRWCRGCVSWIYLLLRRTSSRGITPSSEGNVHIFAPFKSIFNHGFLLTITENDVLHSCSAQY